MIIIGIDPATYELGVGVVNVDKDGEINLLDVYHISTRKCKTMKARLEAIYDEISRIIRKHKPDHVSIESQYLAINPDAFRKICYSVGVILVAVFLNSEAEISIIEASRWRKVALGKGNASKKEAVKQMSQLFNLNPSDHREDDFEALGVAVATARLISSGDEI